MKIPNRIQLYGQDINVNLTTTPEIIPGKGRVLGRYDPAVQEITLFYNERKPCVTEANYIHEVIEAIDTLGDLQLNHTQISALASSLHQVLMTQEFDEDEYTYAEAA